MSVERPLPMTGADVPTLPPGAAEKPSADPEALQILSTEHWSLLATRSMIWNESFARTGMFFTVLSGATVALALVAQATSFGREFVIFTLVLLPIVIFVGVATFFRIVDANREDGFCVIGMNRIRAGYLERRPDLARFFTTGSHDDFPGLLKTISGDDRPQPQGGLPFILRGFVTTPSTLAAVVSAVSAVLVGIIVKEIGASLTLAVVIGAAGFAVLFGVLGYYQYRSFTGLLARHVPRFPTPSA